MKYSFFFNLATLAVATPSVVKKTPQDLELISLLPAAQSNVQYAGVNIAGFDFGCDIQGTCNLSSTFNIVRDGTALAQMQHFASQTGLNAFRLPVGWQFLVENGVAGSPLNATSAAAYDGLVQGCLNTTAQVCIVDVHNYARFDGKIVGQGGPDNRVLVDLWTRVAGRYANESRVAFGVMNEPHDLPSIETWAQTVQEVVTAIRKVGATSQMVLLPGNNFTSAAAFVESGSADALSKVKNPDGSTTNLVFDVHRYLDSDNSGTHTECVTNNIDGAFKPLAQYLRQNKRVAFLTETGGGNTDSCLKLVCEQLDFINQNADVYLGWVGWAAGGFDQKYELVETPVINGTGTNATMTDTPLMSKCIAGRFKASGAARLRKRAVRRS